MIQTFLILLCVAAPRLFAQPLAKGGSPDPIFAAVPFDKWLAEGDQAPIRWVLRLSTNELSNHQRIKARVDIQVDGNELLKRRGKGTLVTLVQFTDNAGAIYQSHGAMGLKDVKEAASTVDVIYTQDAFVLPGDYRVALCLFDSATGEHNVAHRTLHVAPLKSDPLPGMWENLPPVEFVSGGEPPDSWFLPYLRERLILPLETRRKIRIDLLVNVSSSEPPEGAKTAKASNLAVILPALKVISQMDVRNGTMNVALLDLARHSVSDEQDSVRELDWRKIRAGLKEANPNVIDVHSLEKREQNAQFFVSEVRRRLANSSAEALPVLIVLSGPMSFQGGENLRPIDLGKSPDYRVFYIRYHMPPVRPVLSPFPVPLGPQRRNGPAGPALHPVPLEPPDSLERTLKPLEPRLFDVDSPEQFRKALATLMAEISKI